MSDSRRMTVLIDGMSCAGCVRRVDSAIGSVGGVARVETNLPGESARIEADGAVPLRDVASALDRAGTRCGPRSRCCRSRT